MELRLYPNADHPDIAGSYNNIGNAHYGLCKYEKAIEYHEKALAMELRLYPNADHPDIAGSYNNIGNAYYGLCKYEKAIEYHESTGDGTAALSERRPSGDCGELQQHRERLLWSRRIRKGYRIPRKALAMQLRLYPNADHPEIAVSYNNIGSAYYGLGEYEKAIAYHEKALAMELRLYPNADHPDIAKSYNNIGNAYHGLGKYEKAIEYCEKSPGDEMAVLSERRPSGYCGELQQHRARLQ